ncbi:MAG: exopolysaccharide biosynthesis polyprenyl glycosylphosphotransferase [Acidimicrobiia bacterium]
MRRRFLLSVLASDFAALMVGLSVASLIVFGTPAFWNAQLPPGESIWPLVGLCIGGLLLGTYASLRMWARGAPRPSYGRAVAIVGLAGAFTAVGLVLARAYWSRPFVAWTLAAWMLGALAHRAWRRRRPWSEQLMLITAEKGLADDLRAAPHASVLAVYDPAGDPPQSPEHDATIVVDLRPVMSDQMASFVSSWDLAGNRMRPLASVYEEHTGRLPLVHLADGWELTAPVARNEYAPFKRGVDIVLTLITAPLWILLGGVIWLAVRVDSPGGAIYTQERVGWQGMPFKLYKFRTMVADAERNGPQFAEVNDHRVTRVGRWLRRFRVDEIPQLWNVLKGDLSLVGPRPERPMFTEQYAQTIPFYAYRHLTRPGVTGWAQVNYGYADDEADTIDKLTYDLYYVKHMSPWLDLQILGRSVWTVLSGFGAQ